MTDELLDPIFGATGVASTIDSAALVHALCEAEAALARACAGVGLIDPLHADAVVTACGDLACTDPAALGVRAAASGNPVVPLVVELRSRVRAAAGADAALAVHLGATSQDILDTALMLVTSRALDVVVADLTAAAEAIASLARDHRDTPIAGRTLLQQAVPTTFGALAAVWGTAIDRARQGLADVTAALPAQLGGAAGTLAPLHPHGLAVLTAYCADVGLREPSNVWHTDRGVIVTIAGALGAAGAAIAKIATDLVLLAQSELAEVGERAPGGSSAMAHKQNPIAAITARAGALQAPGLVSTLLVTAAPELQRGAGAWHAEWVPLTGLIRAVGGAAARLRAALDIDVHVAAMATNLERLAGTLDVGDTGHAGDLVDRYLRIHGESER